MKIDLQTPVTMPDGSIIKSVVLRRLKMKDFRAIHDLHLAGDHFGFGLAMVAALTGLSVEFVEELDPRDFSILAEHCRAYAPNIKEFSNG